MRFVYSNKRDEQIICYIKYQRKLLIQKTATLWKLPSEQKLIGYIWRNFCFRLKNFKAIGNF